MVAHRFLTQVVILAALIAALCPRASATRQDAASDAFLRAVILGDTKGVKEALAKGVDVNTRNVDGTSALMMAVGDVETLTLLLDKGAEIKAKNKYGHTALYVAVQVNKEMAIHILLDKGADIGVKDLDQNTLLMLAAHNGNLDLVALLVGKGLDVNASGAAGQTALMGAAKADSKGAAICALLLSKGADVNAKMILDGSTALLTAAEYGHPEAMTVLLAKGAQSNAKFSDGRTLLFAAAYGGNMTAIKIALDKGLSVNATTTAAGVESAAKRTPLMEAARYNDRADAVRLLIAGGAKVDAQDESGKTALMLSIENSIGKSTPAECVKVLIAKGANLNLKDHEGKTALTYAKAANQAAIVLLLKKSGAK